MDCKDFTTFERQIEILKEERNLKFISEETAIKALQRFGYYNIINGYKDPYVEKVAGKEQYKNDVTFEQIYSLYTLDRAVRNQLMNAMLEFEDNLRTAIAHTIGEAFTAEQSAYLDPKNYRLGKLRYGSYQLNEILLKFDKIISDDAQPVKHYRDTYGNVPPWILLKGASFGNLVNFTKLQKAPQKERIISLLYDFPPELAQLQTVKDLFMDMLFVCLDYRNRAAHGGRIYNYKTKSTFRYSTLLHDRLKISAADYRNGYGHTGFIALTESLLFLSNRGPWSTLRGSVSYYIKEHCALYPGDKAYLQNYFHVE